MIKSNWVLDPGKFLSREEVNKLLETVRKSKGYDYEAARIESIRIRKNWSLYVTQLIKNIQKSIRQQYDICKLRFLLYPSKLEPQDLTQIKQDDAGVIWLDKD